MGVILFVTFVDFGKFWKIVRSCGSTRDPANSYENRIALQNFEETEPIFTILGGQDIIDDRPLATIRNRENVIQSCNDFLENEKDIKNK